MPSFLHGEARAEWRRVVPQIEKMGMLAVVDRGVLIRYCTAWADWCDLTEKLAQTGVLARRREGVVRNPLWMIRADAEATLSDLGKQLGLTPNARIRAGVVHEFPAEGDEAEGPTAIEDYKRRLKAI